MSKQWGNGFHKGAKEGMRIGELVGKGAAECEFSEIASRLHMLAMAMECAHQERKEKTDVWWAWFVGEAQKEILSIAESIPGVANGIFKYIEDSQP